MFGSETASVPRVPAPYAPHPLAPIAPPEPVVLVVADEPQVQRQLHAALTSHAYQVLTAASVAEAVRLTTAHQPALLLLDLAESVAAEHALLGQLRDWTAVPVLVLSGRDTEEQIVAALDAGADDYLVKPFGLEELLARMRRALRKRRPVLADDKLACGSLRIDAARHSATCDGAELRLTPLEFKLLQLLARHAGKVLTHGQIQAEVWGRAGANRRIMCAFTSRSCARSWSAIRGDRSGC